MGHLDILILRICGRGRRSRIRRFQIFIFSFTIVFFFFVILLNGKFFLSRFFVFFCLFRLFRG
ncbi:hypothetical protein AMR74_04435 [Halorubrum tropicale]|uniref:Uncharacterized protein n=1 Tax=Halorubrum tropicale TaxID=1765655 RepID=A0A0M9ATS1_9EURY|nr:hypothetical protein AMR74_04435 [Halorubrum tropicale]